jgi:cytidylate kinase
MNSEIISIDGPSAVGKTTIGSKIAQNLNFSFLDSGCIYRFFGYLKYISKFSVQEILRVNFYNREYVFLDARSNVYFKDENISDILQNERIANIASELAQDKHIRKLASKVMLNYVQKEGNSVVVGRDIGSMVFPKARLKLFLNADLKVRAMRRAVDLSGETGYHKQNFLEVDLQSRDARDMSRMESPLVKAKDAIEINNDHLSIEDSVGIILQYWKVHQVGCVKV